MRKMGARTFADLVRMAEMIKPKVDWAALSTTGLDTQHARLESAFREGHAGIK
jgi:hypothetical protein